MHKYTCQSLSLQVFGESQSDADGDEQPSRTYCCNPLPGTGRLACAGLLEMQKRSHAAQRHGVKADMAWAAQRGMWNTAAVMISRPCSS